ncbi:MAG: HAD family phosphatase [Oscillospiraceae bacterium]|nr:HAD family phosphatase [Oscillospiraceae bacterium]
MHNIKIIALDLDGTLLNSNKELTPASSAALKCAADAGMLIVPTTGRFYGGMPEEIRQLPFIKYAITINGAQVFDVLTGEVLYKAELPHTQAVQIMEFLDEFPVIYDCYQDNDAWMTAKMKERIDETVSSVHYRKMLHELRKPVDELKQVLIKRARGVQKVQFFTNKPEVREFLMEELPRRFSDICVTSSTDDNVEINQKHANKGEALLALAEHLGIKREETLAFGDGYNDLSMLKTAGIGVAMANACDEAKKIADRITLSCDENGVAHGIEEICFKER